MWDWIKRFRRTETRVQPQPLEAAFLLLAKSQAEIVKKLQQTVDKQHETLDRIVMAKYDRPFAVNTPEVKGEQMPLWGLNDQGEVREDILESLSMESDADFINRASKGIQ